MDVLIHNLLHEHKIKFFNQNKIHLYNILQNLINILYYNLNTYFIHKKNFDNFKLFFKNSNKIYHLQDLISFHHFNNKPYHHLNNILIYIFYNSIQSLTIHIYLIIISFLMVFLCFLYLQHLILIHIFELFFKNLILYYNKV